MSRCSLCGGKLKNHVCVECGLDNRKCDKDYKNYHVNESSCDGEPLTHVHMDEYDVDERYERPKNEYGSNAHQSQAETYEQTVDEPGWGSTYGEDAPGAGKQQATGGSWTYGGSSTAKTGRKAKRARVGQQPGEGKASKGKFRKIVRILVILGILTEVLPAAFGFVADKFGASSSNMDSYEREFTYDQPEYDQVTYELSATGDAYHVDLLPGYYQVGVQIPEGLYQITYKEGEGDIRIFDQTNGISSYVDFQEEDTGCTMDDVRLYQGAYVQLSTGLSLTLSTENAQTGKLTTMENPNTEVVTIRKDAVAGRDFPAGVYDIAIYNEAEEGSAAKTDEAELTENYYGSVGFYIKDHVDENTDGEDYPTWSAYLTDASWTADTKELEGAVRSVVLPEGSKVKFADEDIAALTLTPSGVIKDTNYASFYDTNLFQ